MRAVVGEVAEVGGSRVTVPWGVPAEVFEDRAEVLASDALQRAGLPGDGDDFGLMATSRPGRYVLMQGRAPVWNPGAELKDGRLVPVFFDWSPQPRSEEHTSELQSLMRISYAVFCLKKKTQKNNNC